MRLLTIKAGALLIVGGVALNLTHKQISIQSLVNSLLPDSLTMAFPAVQKTTDNIVFPSDGGVINVKNAPYNAKGDGVTDDTEAIQQALSDYPNQNKIIYLPKGTYLVSNQLQWPAGSRGGQEHKRTILQGQNTGTTIIKLEQNYRSTKAILDAANAVIKHNEKKYEKNLWTEQEGGHLPTVSRLDNEYEEANFIVEQINKLRREEYYKYADFTVLYRMNAQSRSVEDILRRENIPYKMIGCTCSSAVLA